MLFRERNEATVDLCDHALERLPREDYVLARGKNGRLRRRDYPSVNRARHVGHCRTPHPVVNGGESAARSHLLARCSGSAVVEWIVGGQIPL